MTIANAKDQRELASDLFDTFIQIITPVLFDNQDHLEPLIDAKFSILGRFDAEINTAQNFIDIENAMR